VPSPTKNRGKTLANKVDKISLGIDAKPRVAAKVPKGKAGASKNRLK
jgi:hypothetical protein